MSKIPTLKKGRGPGDPDYTYKLCSPVITLSNGLLYHLQQSKLLGMEVHAQLLSATVVLIILFHYSYYYERVVFLY